MSQFSTDDLYSIEKSLRHIVSNVINMNMDEEAAKARAAGLWRSACAYSRSITRNWSECQIKNAFQELPKHIRKEEPSGLERVERVYEIIFGTYLDPEVESLAEIITFIGLINGIMCLTEPGGPYASVTDTTERDLTFAQ